MFTHSKCLLILLPFRPQQRSLVTVHLTFIDVAPKSDNQHVAHSLHMEAPSVTYAGQAEQDQSGNDC